MNRIFGVDFSGAQDAGEHIWVTEGELDGGILRVGSVRPASSLPSGGSDLESALAGLRELILDTPRGAFGIDVPFGLPEQLVEAGDWQAFVAGFRERYPDPEAFREACQAASETELKRRTDREAGTPFSPYNLRMYKQTYHAIADLLAPLVAKEACSVLPMDEPEPDRPWLMEVCPACTLQEEGLDERYKGTGPDRRDGRVRLLQQLERRHSISLTDRSMRSRILEDAAGDGLDSLVAAHAVARTVSDPRRLSPADRAAYRLEGYVYL